MRKLTEDEKKVLCEPYDASEWMAIESTIQELANLGVGTCCGTVGNKCFQKLSESGYSDRKVRGWYLNEGDDEGDLKVVEGMFHIECDNPDDAMKIDDIAQEGDGSLREECESQWPGFWEFEIE